MRLTIEKDRDVMCAVLVLSTDEFEAALARMNEVHRNFVMMLLGTDQQTGSRMQALQLIAQELDALEGV